MLIYFSGGVKGGYMPTTVDWNDIAAEAYEAYAEAVGHKAVNGDDLGPWKFLRLNIQAGWIAASRRAVKSVQREQLANLDRMFPASGSPNPPGEGIE